jgi:hypothetical protein
MRSRVLIGSFETDCHGRLATGAHLDDAVFESHTLMITCDPGTENDKRR